ncbi:hypothetical protein K461DRAFT_318164 [Myriangium duriaei CBS 260.36]|uniref:Uncharacterized protein n=1 Tax=Myriangium duriaei CBS 260.36 TaxID=1168546 RepID=A0A9P4JAA3_9PEZI|nr:hypothetical protein K461DRAFT_318164 [Myriangium duriaei CBS 260.36]
MGYFYYSLTFFFLLAATVLYFTRAMWLPHAPPIPYITAPGPVPDAIYNLLHRPAWQSTRYQPVPTFQDDVEAGLSSSSFNLAENIEGGDSRAGLDAKAKDEVRRIMKEKRVDFDEARRMYVEERFGRENIGRDGRPRDPKAVMFDRL